MSDSELPLCPVCKKGRMRPFESSGTTGDEYNRPINESRTYQCDNDDCKHKESNQSLFESH
jgi:hypothetical protein